MANTLDIMTKLKRERGCEICPHEMVVFDKIYFGF